MEHSISIAGTSLEHFEIVYEKKSVLARRIAVLLMAHLKDAYGVCLPFRDDSTDESEHEIRVGNTCRTDIKVRDTEFVVYASTQHLKAVFGSTFAYEALRVYLVEELFSKADLSLPHGWLYSRDISDQLTDGRQFAHNQQGSLRFLTANIYGAGKNCVERMKYLQAAFIEYQPDIIALQEVSVKETVYEENIAHLLLADGYREIWEDCPNNNEPLLIRYDRFDVIESGHHLFTMANNGNSKQVSWAVLKDKREGRIFASFSTHFYYDDDEYGLLTKLQNAVELRDICTRIYEKYHCPIIGGGDLNGTKNDAHIKRLYEYGFENTHDKAIYKNCCGSCSERCVPDEELGILMGLKDVINRTPEYERFRIDHVLTFGEHMKINTNVIVADETVRLGTDHAILYVDADYPETTR